VDSGHVTLLVVGLVVVFLVGQLLISAGRRYPARSAPGDGGAAAPAATLLAALPIGGSPTTKFLVQTGILLIALAIIYGIAPNLLGRRRDEAMVAEFEARAHPPNEARLTARRPVNLRLSQLSAL